MKNFSLLLFTIILLTSCEEKISADMLVVNATVYTANENMDTAEAFAVKDGKILEVGTSNDIKEKYKAPTIYDLNKKTVLPGFIDSHAHFYGLGLNQKVIDLVGSASYDEILQRLETFQQKNKADFIEGRGWNQNLWETKEFPTKDKLDEKFPDIPVVLMRIDGHAYLVNQKALDLAGIDSETTVEGGMVEIKDGNLTGILIDGAMNLMDSIQPAITGENASRALMDAQEICLSYGLTTISDAGLDRETIELIDEMQQAGQLKIKIYAMISNTPENLDYYLQKGIIKTDHLHVRSVKVYGDGALGSRGAALKKPYSDHPENKGLFVTPVSEIQKLAKRIAASDYQMNTHAIGDAANEAVLKAYVNALGKDNDRRWRVEHAQVVSDVDFKYYKSGIIPSVQPTHATSDMHWAQERVGEDRMKGAYAYKKLLDIAGMIALGTDFPVEEVSPFHTFYAAIARKDLQQFPAEGFQKHDALSREETLKGMTIWGAYANFEEDEKGSLETGKFADFIILSKDIMQVDEDEIPGIKVETTFINGKPVHKK